MISCSMYDGQVELGPCIGPCVITGSGNKVGIIQLIISVESNLIFPVIEQKLSKRGVA